VAAMTKHARLSPSSSERWMHCAGSVRLCEGLPDVKNAYMLEGTAAHELAAYALKGNDPEWRDTDYIEVEGQPYPIDDEMREGVQTYIDYVRHLQALYRSELWVETPVDLAPLNPPEEIYGTSDAILDSLELRRLDVVDLKYGQGVQKAAAGNPQLMNYLLGALLKVAHKRGAQKNGADSLGGALAMFDTLEVHIVQPRGSHVDGPIRSWEVSADEVRAFAAQVINAARATQDPNAPLTPGEWCRFCPAQAMCPALREFTQQQAEMVFGMVPVDTPTPPERLTLEEVGAILRQVPIVEDWIRALRQRIEAELTAGRVVPGWKLVQKRPVRRWANEEEVLRWAKGSGLEASEVYVEPELRSPAQMEKVVGKKNLPEDLYVKASSGLALVSESDPRPEVTMVGPAEFTALLPAAPTEEEG